MSLPQPLAQHTLHDLAFDGRGGPLRVDELWGLAHGIVQQMPAGARRIVLACQDRALFSAGLLAAWHRGVPVVLPHHLAAREVERLAAPTDAWAVHDLSERRGLDARSLVTEPHDPLALCLEPDREVARVYTSGSTGTPTAHPKTAGQLLGEVACLLQCFELQRARVVASVSPHHIYGLLYGVLVPLCSGGVASRETPLQPGAVQSALEGLEADVWVAVPAHLRAVAEAGEAGWLSRTRVFSSAAPLPTATGETLRGQRVWLCEILGSTETGGIAHRLAADVPWRPLPGVTVEASAEGTLKVRSPWLHPDDPSPRPTADRIELAEQGFWHHGRADRVVKVAGRRVDLGALEALLRGLKGVSDARVLTSPTASARDHQLWAAVETRTRTPREVREALRPLVDPVTLPRRIRCTAALPRTTAGKITDAGVRGLFDDQTTWQLPADPVDDDGWDIQVPPSLGYFDGHFEGLPILPGVVQLATIVERARARWPELGALRGMARAKFKAPLSPGDQLHLRLSRKGEGRVLYRLTRDGSDAATGTLEFTLATGGAGD